MTPLLSACSPASKRIKRNNSVKKDGKILYISRLDLVTLGAKSWLMITVWIAVASLIAGLLYFFWVRPTAGTPFISYMGGLDPATHTQYDIDLDEINGLWPIHVVPPSRFRDQQHGIMTYSWLATEHKARSGITAAVWLIIVAYAAWKTAQT